MTDNRTTELLDGLRSVGNLHEFAELFGFNWEDDSDWTWHDVAVKMADELEQAIAATLGNSRAERTCKQEERGWGTEGDHARVWLTCGHDCMVPTVQDLPNYCPNCGAKVVGRMSEPIIEYRYEFNVTDFVSKYAERISRVIDEQTLTNVEHQLAMYGYVKVVRCRDCKYHESMTVSYLDRPLSVCTALRCEGAEGDNP